MMNYLRLHNHNRTQSGKFSSKKYKMVQTPVASKIVFGCKFLTSCDVKILKIKFQLPPYTINFLNPVVVAILMRW